MARQLALHSNLASVIHQKLSQNKEPYASNWLERLRAIKRLRQRHLPDPVQGGLIGLPGTGAGGGGLSASTQELTEPSGAALHNAGNSQVQNGTHATASTGIIGSNCPTSGTGSGGLQKRNSFVVDDFTEYV